MLFASCADDKDVSADDVNDASELGAMQLTAEQRQMLTPLTTFSLNMMRAVAADGQGKSLVVSPLSAAFVLGMLDEGATGVSHDELLHVIGFDGKPQATVRDFLGKLLKHVREADPKVMLQFANNLTVNERYTLKSDFEDALRQGYEAAVCRLDFSSEQAVRAINDWCSEQTHGLIPAIIDTLDPAYALCLLNSLYFKGGWRDGLADAIESALFTTADGGHVPVCLMCRDGEALYAQGEDYQALRLPFGDGHFAMTFLLPAQNDGLSSLLSKLSADGVLQMALETKSVDVRIPMFSTASQLDLIPVMRRLGLESVFDAGRSQLGGIVDSSEKFCVSMIKQEVRISADETGVEGAAVTVVAPQGAVIDRPKTSPLKFHADHPFLYFISNVETGCILFIGQYMGA